LQASEGLSPSALASSPRVKSIISLCFKAPTGVLRHTIDRELNLNLPAHALNRARKLLFREDVDQVNKDLADIGATCAAYARLNPRAVVNVEVDSDNQFKQWGIAFDNSGIVDCILDVLFADGGHTKNPACRCIIIINCSIILALNLSRTRDSLIWLLAGVWFLLFQPLIWTSGLLFLH
jgi:hypothetical protein